jgi:hypothetical protein
LLRLDVAPLEATRDFPAAALDDDERDEATSGSMMTKEPFLKKLGDPPKNDKIPRMVDAGTLEASLMVSWMADRHDRDPSLEKT